MLKGRALEHRVNKTNIMYRKTKMANIKKEEVPILLTKKGMVVQLSTVDYTGCLKGGLFIAFDAKECASKTSFPLSNIHQHQLEYLKLCNELGGVCFFLIQFTKMHSDEAFKVPATFIAEMWDRGETGGRKSIKYEEFHKEWLVPIDDYLGQGSN